MCLKACHLLFALGPRHMSSIHRIPDLEPPLTRLLLFPHTVPNPALASFFKKFLFISYLLAIPGLRCCTWAFSSSGEQGLLFLEGLGPLDVVASFIVEHSL